jgi:hypothetical protein
MRPLYCFKRNLSVSRITDISVISFSVLFKQLRFKQNRDVSLQSSGQLVTHASLTSQCFHVTTVFTD